MCSLCGKWKNDQPPKVDLVIGRNPQGLSAVAPRHRMKFAIAQANPAPAIEPVVVAATRLHLSPHDRAHSEADGPADCRTASATRDATDRSARHAPGNRALADERRCALASAERMTTRNASAALARARHFMASILAVEGLSVTTMTGWGSCSRYEILPAGAPLRFLSCGGRADSRA